MSEPERLSLAPEPAGLPAKLAASISCVFLVVGGIMFMVFERKSSFIRFYAMQSILFGGAWFVLSVILRVLKEIILEIPFLGSLVAPGLSLLKVVALLAAVVIYVVQIAKALSGKEWEIPYLGGIARKQLSGK